MAGGRPARLGPPWGRGRDAGTGSPGTACHARQEALGFRKGLPRSRNPNCLARWADQNRTGSGNPVLRLRVQDSHQDPLAKVPMALRARGSRVGSGELANSSSLQTPSARGAEAPRGRHLWGATPVPARAHGGLAGVHGGPGLPAWAVRDARERLCPGHWSRSWCVPLHGDKGRGRHPRHCHPRPCAG